MFYIRYIWKNKVPQLDLSESSCVSQISISNNCVLLFTNLVDSYSILMIFGHFLKNKFLPKIPQLFATVFKDFPFFYLPATDLPVLQGICPCPFSSNMHKNSANKTYFELMLRYFAT